MDDGDGDEDDEYEYEPFSEIEYSSDGSPPSMTPRPASVELVDDGGRELRTFGDWREQRSTDVRWPGRVYYHNTRTQRSQYHQPFDWPDEAVWEAQMEADREEAAASPVVVVEPRNLDPRAPNIDQPRRNVAPAPPRPAHVARRPRNVFPGPPRLDPDPQYFGPGPPHYGPGPQYYGPGHPSFYPGPQNLGPDPRGYVRDPPTRSYNGWTEYQVPNGRCYYMNDRTQECQWFQPEGWPDDALFDTHPRRERQALNPQEDPPYAPWAFAIIHREPRTLNRWAELRAPCGRFYYLSRETRIAQWRPPEHWPQEHPVPRWLPRYSMHQQDVRTFHRWTEFRAPCRRCYYWNEETGALQWYPPEDWLPEDPPRWQPHHGPPPEPSSPEPQHASKRKRKVYKGWTEHVSTSGREYYWHEASNVSCWTRPIGWPPGRSWFDPPDEPPASDKEEEDDDVEITDPTEKSESSPQSPQLTLSFYIPRQTRVINEWLELETASGRCYYVNREEEYSQWEAPPDWPEKICGSYPNKGYLTAKEAAYKEECLERFLNDSIEAKPRLERLMGHFFEDRDERSPAKRRRGFELADPPSSAYIPEPSLIEAPALSKLGAQVVAQSQAPDPAMIHEF